MKISIVELSKLCHEVNKAYWIAIGDTSQVSWEKAENWQHIIVLNDVVKWKNSQ